MNSTRKAIPTNIDRAVPTQAKGLIELALFAPYNEIVQLLGSWNDWNPIDMTKSKDGWWRMDVSLPDGDHLYKFRVKSLSFFAKDQMLDLFDPYAYLITNDRHESTVLRVRNGIRVDFDYEWKHDAVPLPDNRDLVIYEMHIGDFSGGKGDAPRANERETGQFKHAIEKLDYLKELGINCVELMPVKEFPGRGWGYSLRSLFAVENSYGGPAELCRFVDEAHSRGMRVIIDGVYNHAEAEAPLTKIDYSYWFYQENPDPENMHWGPKFNYAHYDPNYDLFPARKYIKESIQFWVERFHVDGIRFDATTAIRDFDVLRELADAAFEKVAGIKPFIAIAEHVPEDPAVTGRPHEGPMNAAWHDSFAQLLQAMLTGKERDGHAPWNLDEFERKMNPALNGYKQTDRYVNYLSSHDHNRAMYILGNDGKIFDDAAFRRMKLGLGILFTLPGLPMIWMGNEFGFAREKTLEPCPLDWTLLKNPNNQGLLNFTKQFTRIRHENPALRADAFQIVLKDQERCLLGWKRWNDAGNVVVTVANLKDAPAGEFTVQDVALEDGIWRDAIHGNDIRVEGGVLRDVIDASEVKVFVKQ